MSGPSTDSDAALALGRRSRSPWWRKDTPRRNTWHAPACTFLSSPIALRDKPYPLPNARGALAFRIDSMPPLRSARGQALRSRDSTRPDFLLAFWQRRGVTIIGAMMQLPRYSPAAPAATARAPCFSFRTVCRSPFDGSLVERLL